ncbi:hypothetical protein Gotur_033583, partial [Gossypium turneri]
MNEQQKMIDKMMESQGSMMAQLTQWLNKGTDKGKGSVLNVEEGDNEGLVYPPDFTPKHCTVFKKLVERLISVGIVKVDDSPGTENPLPNHNESGVNMIGGNMGRKIREDIAEVKIPLRWIWKKMVERGLLVVDSERSFEEKENYCEFHHDEGHKIQECTEFRALVQGLMDNKEMEFYEEAKEERSIYTSESAKVPRVTQPVVIISRPRNDE